MKPLWLAPPGVEQEVNCYFRAVRILHGEQPATLEVAAESYYLLYVNGHPCGKGPARGTRQRNYFDSYDISPFLRPGKNVIALLVYCMNRATYRAAPAQPAFSIRIGGEMQRPGDWRVCVAADWRKDASVYTMQTGFSEWRDLRLEPTGWTEGKGTDDWQRAVAVPADRPIHAKMFIPRDIPLLERAVILPTRIVVAASVPPAPDLASTDVARLATEEEHRILPPHRVEGLEAWKASEPRDLLLQPDPNGEGIALVFDFGTSMAGTFEMEIDGQDGAIVDICHEEALWNGRIRAHHPNPALDYNFADRYILRNGRQVVGNTIDERGFRMVQAVFRNFDTPITVRDVRAVRVRYPFEPRASFACNDTTLNRIWTACQETLKACTTDVFMDCPWRERAFWVNDLMVANRTSLQAFGASALHRRAFRLAFSDVRPDGLIPGVCPCPGTNDPLTFPATNLFMPLMLRDYLLYSGDRGLVLELLPGVLRILETFEEWFDDEGLIAPPKTFWNFFDWAYESTGVSLSGRNTAMLNALYVMAVAAVRDLAAAMHAPVENGDAFSQRAERICQEVPRRFFNRSTRRLADWLEPDGSLSAHASQLAHALALLTPCVPVDWQASMQDALDDEALLAPDLYLTYFILQAMRRCGRETAALARIRRYWGPIADSGSPTIWEAGVHTKGKAAFHGSGSLCHGFATAPVDFIQTAILGVEPLTPGFATFRLAPVPCDLMSAEGTVPTPGGDIRIAWQRLDRVLQMHLDVPPETSARCDDGRSYGPGRHRFQLPLITAGEEAP